LSVQIVCNGILDNVLQFYFIEFYSISL
jgi:hypothetical protein